MHTFRGENKNGTGEGSGHRGHEQCGGPRREDGRGPVEQEHEPAVIDRIE